MRKTGHILNSPTELYFDDYETQHMTDYIKTDILIIIELLYGYAFVPHKSIPAFEFQVKKPIFSVFFSLSICKYSQEQI